MDLKHRRLRRKELQLHEQASDDVELREDERDPHPYTGTPGTRCEQQPDREYDQEDDAVEEVEREHVGRMPPDEPPCSTDAAEHAAPILDDDPNPCVVDHQIHENERPSEDRVESD